MLEFGFDPQLVSYIINHVLPEYEVNDPGHRVDHAMYVINRSVKFAEEMKVDRQIAFVAAAFHDVKVHMSRKYHEQLGAMALYGNEFIREYFHDGTVIVQACEAIEDHRASCNHEPRNIYGKILSTADRNTDIDDMLRRCFLFNADRLGISEFGISLEDADKVYEAAYDHLKEKFGAEGYGKDKCFVPDPQFTEFVTKMAELTKSCRAPRTGEFHDRFVKVNGLQNLK